MRARPLCMDSYNVVATVDGARSEGDLASAMELHTYTYKHGGAIERSVDTNDGLANTT